MKLLILNGPNLNLLGSREPDIYGRESYDMLCQQIYRHADTIGCTVEVFQSNHEGTLIDAIQAAQAGYSGIVINPGAYAHYSYAIYDALRALPEGARVLADSATANSRIADVPAVEVHISDITAREPFRAVSVTAAACVKTICGHGLAGYLEAMDYLMATASDRSDSAAPHTGCGGAACV